jgi:hypothetical protein
VLINFLVSSRFWRAPSRVAPLLTREASLAVSLRFRHSCPTQRVTGILTSNSTTTIVPNERHRRQHDPAHAQTLKT